MKKKFTQILLASVIVSSTLVPFVQAEAAGTNQTTVSQAGMTLSQQQFIQSIANDAQDLQKEEKILTSVTLAQAILESNWGKSGLSTSANNLFGIKGSYEGSSVSMGTQEFSSGKAYHTQADFRKYPDKKASLVDHAQLLLTEYLVMQIFTQQSSEKQTIRKLHTQFKKQVMQLIQHTQKNSFQLLKITIWINMTKFTIQ